MSNSRTIKIEGMHCGSCVKKTSEALKRVAGVLDAVVSLEEHNAKLTLAYDVDDEKLDKLLRAAGDYRIAGNDSADTDHTVHEKPESLYPLILIASYIAGAICLIAWTAKDWSPGAMMRHFMASFFLVFSFFKLLDLRGFVDAYRSYDLLAKAIPGWAMVYPFVEL